ncbi:MAG: hypothetical protein AAF587_43880 [Bacteroidota bacterium]
MTNSLTTIKQTALVLFEDLEEEKEIVLKKTLDYIGTELRNLGETNADFDTLHTRFQTLMNECIAGILLDHAYNQRLSLLTFSVHRFIEARDEFVVSEFGKDFGLAKDYSLIQRSEEDILAIREELVQVKKSSGELMKKDAEEETIYLAQALIDIDQLIHDKQFIDKGFLNIKHQYIHLMQDLIKGIIVNLSDYYAALKKIKKAVYLYLNVADHFPNTSLNQEVLDSVKAGNFPQQTGSENHTPPNPLAPFSKEDIYNSFIMVLKDMDNHLSNQRRLPDDTIQKYALLQQEFTRRQLSIKPQDHLLYQKLSPLFPM